MASRHRKGRVWVVDDDKSIRWVLDKALSDVGYQTHCFSTPGQALQRLEEEPPDLLFSDIRMPGVDGIELLRRVRQAMPSLPVIIMTAYTDLQQTVSAFEGGAYDYISKPFDIEEVLALARRVLPAPTPDGADGEAVAREAESVSPELHSLIGTSPAMQEVFSVIGKLSRTSLTVLISGESGTGKELIAHALHEHSPRAGKPMIAINAAAIPAELLEAELFGHEKGAFTGANMRRLGYFEQVDGGTLFLDEIGDMPMQLQSRLLRILAEGEFYRVGGQQLVRVDVRIIAATHQDLERRVAEGLFREDLLHRLNVIRLQVPALRERSEDIPALCQYFLQACARELNCRPKRLLPETLDCLMQLPWPGNIRQLENVCRHLTVMTVGEAVHVDHLPMRLLCVDQAQDAETELSWQHALASWARQRLRRGESGLLDTAVEGFETTLIGVAMEHSKGSFQDAAKLLGWGRNTLRRKMKKYDREAD